MVVKVSSSSSLGFSKTQLSKQPSLWKKCLLILRWRAGLLLFCSLVVFLGFMKMYASSMLLTVKDDESKITNAAKSSTLSSIKNAYSYDIVVDAGSTGSRIHVYKFSDQSGFPVLLKEDFEQVRPGLSSYVQNPGDGVASIEKLLKIALAIIPQDMQSQTKLVLRATAGLRLLSQKQADTLLQGVAALFEKYSFQLPPSPVGIMNGVDEGKFGWIAVNYLLNRLGPSKNQFTVGTIDLGGGSMQITFAPNELETVENSPSQFITQSKVFGSDLKLYCHSYLGLGLMSAREAVLKTFHKENDVVMASCFPLKHKTTWKNGQTKYEIEGSGNLTSCYTSCREASQKAVVGNFHRPAEIKHKTFYVFSYFFDRAVQLKLVDEKGGGVVTVQQYIDAATTVCTNKQFDSNNPFLCLDMVLISTFLEDGYGFDRTMKLITTDVIDGKETSWTLGAAFALLN